MQMSDNSHTVIIYTLIKVEVKRFFPCSFDIFYLFASKTPKSDYHLF